MRNWVNSKMVYRCTSIQPLPFNSNPNESTFNWMSPHTHIFAFSGLKIIHFESTEPSSLHCSLHFRFEPTN